MKAIDYIRRRSTKEKKRMKEDFQFESTSIGDMAFLLLIFFIVTGSFVLRQGIFFNLPSKTASAVRVDEKNIVDVFPDNKGFIYGGEILNRENFKSKLQSQIQSNDKTIVVINMDKKVKYDRLIDTISVAKEIGVKEVSLKDFEDEK